MSPSLRALKLVAALALTACPVIADDDIDLDSDVDTDVEDSDTDAVDTTAPSVTITDDVANATATGPVTFSFLFHEDVGTSFVAADIDVSGGAAGAFNLVDGRTATLVVTPPTEAAGTITVAVAAGKFQDLAGNANTASATASQGFDTREPAPAGTTLVDFEGDPPTLTGFGGAEDATVVVDPTDASNKVGRVLKSSSAELWAGATVSYCPGNTTVPLPFSASETRIAIRVWSPDASIPVRLKVENASNPGVSVETEATTTVAGAWQTLTFDFKNEASGTAKLNLDARYDRMSVFFNFGTPGSVAGEKTYYLDDIVFVDAEFDADCPGGGDGGVGVPLSFDNTDVTYTLIGFGGAEDATVVTDPTSGSNKVARVVKSGSAELWAGTTVATLPGEAISTLPITSSRTRMTVRVWTDKANIPVRLKVESASDPTRSVETETRTTVVSGWQTLTFDFAKEASGTAALNPSYTFNKLSIFFDFGRTGAAGGGGTYYFDDIDLVP